MMFYFARDFSFYLTVVGVGVVLVWYGYPTPIPQETELFWGRSSDFVLVECFPLSPMHFRGNTECL